jgi:hypothetical protein
MGTDNKNDPHGMDEARKCRSLYASGGYNKGSFKASEQARPLVRRSMKSPSVGLKAVKQSRAATCPIILVVRRSCLSSGIKMSNLFGSIPLSFSRAPSKAGAVLEVYS